MLARTWTALLAFAVVVAITIQLAAPGSSLIAVVAGLWLVLGGTIVAARVSHSQAALGALRASITSLLRESPAANGTGPTPAAFYEAARCFRYGRIRPAEAAIRFIPEPVLRSGTQLVLDGFSREQVMLAMQRQVADERDRCRAPVELLRAMGSYAPTLGMLGTLLGLVQMLFGLGVGDVQVIGSSMGFAMLTTVYGLALSNLVLKPLASKLEERGRATVSACIAQMQAVLLLHDRHHLDVIREVMEGTQPGGRRDGVNPELKLAAAG
ncbi:MAG: MotA/TolQ/ExbB proton channel family protein [Pseudomonadales bacterium]